MSARLRVIDPVGAYLCDYGSRQVGEMFDNIPNELAQELAATYPTIYELVDDDEQPEEQE